MVETSRPPRERLVAPGQIEHFVADMTVTVSADVPLAALQQRLAQVGQWLPIDGDADRPVGQLVEQNSTGPLRLGYGAWRDLLLGAQFTNGTGELITAGGMTMKNVAGYDLTKFMVGQGGVFGRLETITTRTYKQPTAALLATFAPDVRVVNRLLPSDCRPQWAILTDTALHCGYLGDARAIDHYRRALPAHAPRETIARTPRDDAEHRAALWCCVGEALFRAAVAPTRIADFVKVARPLAWAADAAFGVVLGSTDLDDGGTARLHDAARVCGGSVYAHRTDGTLRMAEPEPVRRALLERLKHAFDPDGTLAPLPWMAAQSTSAPPVPSPGTPGEG
jgi:FAD/FMN-containing dehydrogenase